MKKFISAILALALMLGCCGTAFANVTLGDGASPVTYSYRTATLTEYADSSVNPYGNYGLRMKVKIPHYFGKIEADLRTSEGSGKTDVVVLYVPDDKWDGKCYYSGITAEIINDGNYHMYQGAETIVTWKEWYNYGFLPADGGIYVYDGDSVQMNFLNGPGLYTAYATIPFSVQDTGTTDYQAAYAENPSSVLMTAMGYPFILVLDDATITYFINEGKLDRVSSYDWPELSRLLRDRSCIIDSSGSSFSLNNFVRKNTYRRGDLFDLINDESWYMRYVTDVYELGLMNGYTDRTFRADGSVSLAEVIAIAAKMNDIYYGGSGEFTPGTLWYSIFVSYAINKGIIRENDFSDYNRKATRAEIAYILGNALPDEVYPRIAAAAYIKDISSDTPYISSILKLYESGIVCGYTDSSFGPSKEVSRGELATMIVKIVDKTLRKVD